MLGRIEQPKFDPSRDRQLPANYIRSGAVDLFFPQSLSEPTAHPRESLEFYRTAKPDIVDISAKLVRVVLPGLENW